MDPSSHEPCVLVLPLPSGSDRLAGYGLRGKRASHGPAHGPAIHEGDRDTWRGNTEESSLHWLLPSATTRDQKMLPREIRSLGSSLGLPSQSHRGMPSPKVSSLGIPCPSNATPYPTIFALHGRISNLPSSIRIVIVILLCLYISSVLRTLCTIMAGMDADASAAGEEGRN